MSRLSERDPADLLPLGDVSFHILLALADGERHGYALMREIGEQSGGTLRVGPATLYRTIARLLDDGLIAETDDRPDPALDDARRRYYRLTRFGRQVAEAETHRLARLVESARARRLVGPADAGAVP